MVTRPHKYYIFKKLAHPPHAVDAIRDQLAGVMQQAVEDDMTRGALSPYFFL